MKIFLEISTFADLKLKDERVMLLTTTNTVEGKRVVHYYGVVSGETIIGANIFRDFSADPENPDSYDFAFTDKLLAEITEQGTEPFYRLGATIENSHRIKAYHIFPPKDNLKWAKICEGIIKHYNHGFANGFHYGIKYWEIWNEPDNERNIEDNPMWKGTKEQASICSTAGIRWGAWKQPPRRARRR